MKDVSDQSGGGSAFFGAVESIGHVERHDPILDCLALLARKWGCPFSRAAMLDGLTPPLDGRLNLDLAAKAATRLGFASKIVRRHPSTIPSLLLPCIVELRNGEACVLLAREGVQPNLRVSFPSLSEHSRTLSVAELDQAATGVVCLVAPPSSVQAELAGTPAVGPRRHWLWAEVRSFWPSWLQIGLSAFLINLLGLAYPVFVMSVYDRVIPNSALSTLWALLLGMLLALVFEFLLRQLRALVLERTGRMIDLRSGSKLFEQALAVPLAVRGEGTGSLASRIREFDAVRDFFTSTAIVAATDLLFIGLGILLLFAIVNWIAVVPLIGILLVVLLTLLAQLPLSHAMRHAQEEGARRHGVLVEALGAIETVKTIAAHAAMHRRWERATVAATRASSSARLWSSLALNATILIQQLAVVTVVVLGVVAIGNGDITVGALIAASMLTGRILAPLASIAQALARAQRSVTALRDINAFMRLPCERNGVIRSGKKISDGRVECRSVTFTYPSSKTPALECVSFTIKAGERVGIAGRVGSGKTTIGRLLCGLYPPDKGLILVDGCDIAALDPAELRAGIGFVAQEPELFDASLRDNIIIGCQEADEAAIADACHVAGVDTFAALHPMGLAMPVGERGRALSGGQRQAVALARTLLKRPRILFLDEPSSAMDIATEAELIGRLQRWLMPEQTLILCSHRVSMLDLTERLILLERGRLIADGPKGEVLKLLKVRGGGEGGLSKSRMSAVS